MSPVCEVFIRAVLAANWQQAFLNLNGLNMVEMLRGLAALDPLDLADLWAQQAAFAPTVNMPRIEYAYNVVHLRKLPAVAPGDLQATGQVALAQAFLAHPTPLVFENDLTGLQPITNTCPADLSEVDFAAAARQLRVDVAAIQAVAQVEAGGRSGFAPDGKPIIRYELHIFQGRTHAKYHHSHPHLSQPSLAAGKPYHHGTQATEWSLLYGAMILRNADGSRRASDAWQSTSWGMFQVMGFNYASVGWTSIDTFIADLTRSSAQQLKAFTGFVTHGHLQRFIVAKNWASFASAYNGSGYAVNHYDGNMAAAYTRISTQRKQRHLAP